MAGREYCPGQVANPLFVRELSSSGLGGERSPVGFLCYGVVPFLRLGGGRLRSYP
jgi:hypothetical protein